MKAKPSHDWMQRRPLLAALMWALIPSCIAFLIAPLIGEAELRKVVYAGAATLLFGVGEGGQVLFLAIC